MGSFGLSSVVFGDPWAALGAFGRPLGLHLSSLEVHWGASEASLGSICRLWGSIGAPLGVIGDHFGDHFAVIFALISTFDHFEHFYNFCDFL